MVESLLERYEFQFLIGTLKTVRGAGQALIGLAFQFLIGTLKTRLKQLEKKVDEQFQFLIGTLKTQAGSFAEDCR